MGAHELAAFGRKHVAIGRRGRRSLRKPGRASSRFPPSTDFISIQVRWTQAGREGARMTVFVTGAWIASSAAPLRRHSRLAVRFGPCRAPKLRTRACAQRGAEPVAAISRLVSAADLQGCESVVHSAAYVEAWGTRADFWQGNVEGTERMLSAAREAGVRRFLHIGTEAVLLRGQHLRDADETHPYPESTPFLYSETKAEAERRAWSRRTIRLRASKPSSCARGSCGGPETRRSCPKRARWSSAARSAGWTAGARSPRRRTSPTW